MKFRKKEINTTIQENKISCWDIAKQSLKLMNESIEALGKTLKKLNMDSNLMKSCKKTNIVNSDELTSQTVQNLKNSIKKLKVCKINNNATKKILNQIPISGPPHRLPN